MILLKKKRFFCRQRSNPKILSSLAKIDLNFANYLLLTKAKKVLVSYWGNTKGQGDATQS